ncbi:MAG: SDR family oxidoreductase [Alphaproteobacteria bacterium]|nr:SDR family oxidoreductase [Alphaproteobacteria bacterium]
MTGRFDGRTCLVTGAAMGIGYAIAERLGSEGARVVVADVKPAEGEDAARRLCDAGCDASFLALDVSSEDGWKQAAAAMESLGAGLDALVNNAGVEAVAPLAELDMAIWRRAMDVNLTGVYLGTRYMAPLLLAGSAVRGAGASVVNISSIMGLIGLPGSSAYAATKGGVRLFTKNIAVEFAMERKNIRVNSVHPGFIQTPMSEVGARRLAEKGLAKDVGEALGQMASMSPMGRLGRPEDIAAGVAFLVSDDAAFMTGAELVIDGGYTAR